MAKGGAKILFGLFFFVVLVAVLAGGGAWYLTEDRVAGYRATALLVVDPGDAPAPPEPAVETESTRAQLQGALGIARSAPTLAPPDYAVLFESDEIARELAAELGGEEEREGDDGEPGMTLSGIKAAMDAETAVALQTQNHVAYQRVIRLHFTAPDPALAAQGADAWAAACARFAASLSAGQRDTRKNEFQEELDTLREELHAAREEQHTLRENAPLEPLEVAVRSTTEALETLKQTVRAAQAEAARGDAALKALKAYVSKAPPAVVMELSMAEATAEAKTAGARAESEFLTGQLEEAEAAAREARTAWAKASREHEAVEEIIARLAPRARALEEKLAAVDRPGSAVRVAANAVQPDTPVGPHRYIIVAGTAILGAIAGMIVYFGLLTLRVYARELDRG